MAFTGSCSISLLPRRSLPHMFFEGALDRLAPYILCLANKLYDFNLTDVIVVICLETLLVLPCHREPTALPTQSKTSAFFAL